MQDEIEKKISTISSVIDVLNGIVNSDKSNEETTVKVANEKKSEAAHSDDSSPERLKTKVIESLSRKRFDSERSAHSRNEEYALILICLNFS